MLVLADTVRSSRSHGIDPNLSLSISDRRQFHFPDIRLVFGVGKDFEAGTTLGQGVGITSGEQNEKRLHLSAGLTGICRNHPTGLDGLSGEQELSSRVIVGCN